MMDRRTFIGSLALGTLMVPRAVPAQPARRVARIGIVGLVGTSDLVGPSPRSPSTNAFVRGMHELGYVYGEHFVTEPRGAEGKPARFPILAAELVRLPADVIVAPGPALPALKQATSTIPIVMAGSADPVGSGYVRSLRRPGENVTGLSLQSVETTGKRLEVLKELVPTAAPVAVLWDRATLNYWQAAEAAAQERGWKLLSIEIRDVGEIEGAFKRATEARAGTLLVCAAGLLFPHAKRIAELAIKTRLPAMYELRPYVEAGGLISYGADVIDIWRRAATFVDRILKGTSPADLPIEQPTEFETVINLKAAKALGLTVPPALRLRADEVIE
jgi:putative tryptophan/tyrosine transport system substrate-binding protein